MSTNVLTNQHPTPNTEEPNSSCDILMCDISISYPNPKVKSAEAERLIKSTFNTKDKAVSAEVTLIRKDYVEDIMSHVSTVRNFFTENTISLGKSQGVRGGTSKIIPAKNFWRVVEFWNKSKSQFDGLTDDFVDRWENEIRPNSWDDIKQLGVTLNDRQQLWFSLSGEQIRSKFYYKFSKSPVANPNVASNMRDLTSELRASLQAELEEEHSKRAQEAYKELRTRLETVVVKLRNKMLTYNPAGGKISDSILTNIEKLVSPKDGNRSLIEDLCVGEGQEKDTLLELAQEANLLCHYDVDSLKGEDGEHMRKTVATEASNLIEKIKGGNTAAEINNMMKF